MARIDLDLATQSKHLNVDGPVVDLIVLHAAGFQQLIPGQDPLWSSDVRMRLVKSSRTNHGSWFVLLGVGPTVELLFFRRGGKYRRGDKAIR